MLEEVFPQELGVKFDRKELNVKALVEEKAISEVARLVEYTLAAALGCKTSEDLMEKMMELSEDD